MGTVIPVNTGATVSGTSENDIFQVLGAPTLLDGGEGYDIANIGVSLNFTSSTLR